MSRLLYTILFIILLMQHLAYSETITVKQDGTGDYTNIQAGINGSSSSNGDTVLVWPGIYYENIQYNGKYIIVASLHILNQDDWYIYNTIIDGNQNGICVLMNGGSNLMEINGFTIRNGKDEDGYGGVKLYSSTGKITNCIVENNYGCGVSGMYCMVYLNGTTIRYNQGEYGGGGIAYGLEMDALYDSINRCNIYLNYAVAGCEIIKSWFSPPQNIYVDTFTVMEPDIHFLFSYDTYNIPVNDMEIHINHAYLEPIDYDLYVNPVLGDNTNSGITPEEPLKTIAFANSLIKPDSISQNNIYLANGLYSSSSNGEALPIGTRSFVSIIGESQDSTIIDAENETYFYRGFGLMHHCKLENLFFINGKGTFYSEKLDNLTFNNIKIVDCFNSLSIGFNIDGCDSLVISRTLIKNNKGGGAINITNMNLNSNKEFYVYNCVIENNRPGEILSQPELIGGGMQIVGSVIPPSSYHGFIRNLQITNNLKEPIPLTGFGLPSALGVDYYCKIDMINTTIGDNTLRGVTGFGTNASRGAELNIYNSILFGDSLKELSLGYPSVVTDPSTTRVYYSDVEGGYSNVVNWNGISTIVWGEGNISLDPLWDTTSMTPYALPWNSPCVNAGTPMYETGMNPPYIIQDDTIFQLITFDYDTIPLPAKDLAGNPRIIDGRIDMGAFEFQDTLNTSTSFIEKVNQNHLFVYPNPFQINTSIEFSITNSCVVNLSIYNQSGQLIKNLIETSLPKGNNRVIWDGKDNWGNAVQSGIYYIILNLNNEDVYKIKIVKI